MRIGPPGWDGGQHAARRDPDYRRRCEPVGRRAPRYSASRRDGVEYTGGVPHIWAEDSVGWRAGNTDNGFVEPNSFGEADIICHKNASPKGSTDTMAKVAAGGTVEFHWNTWPESHVGPVITYVAPYEGDVTSVDKASLKWTKIDATATRTASGLPSR